MLRDTCVIAWQLMNGIYVEREPQQLSLMCNGVISVGEFLDVPVKQFYMNKMFKRFLTKVDSGTKSTKYALCTTLNASTETLNSHLGLQFHAQIILNGYEDNVILSSALVDFYSKCSRIEDVRRISNYIKQHNQVSWTSIISNYTQFGCGAEATFLLKNMLKSDIKPNCFTYVSIITACSEFKEPLKLGSAIHAHVLKLGFVKTSFLISSLIDFYSKCGRVNRVALLFDAMTTRDNILYNSMMVGYCQNFHFEDALKLLFQIREDINPTHFTISSVLNACGSLSLLRLGRQVHSLVLKKALVSNVFVLSSLIDIYSKSGGIDDARSVFDHTIERNSVL